MNFEDLNSHINEWAAERRINRSDASPKQLLKLGEEVGELYAAYLRNDRSKMIDGIGDCLVVLCIFCQQQGLNPTTCLEIAYNEIANRKGTTVNGVFIKQSDTDNEN